MVGYVHPFEEEPLPLSKPTHTDADELPVDVALGKVDYLEVVGFSDHKATADVWYRLLNLGFRIPAAGGTDAMPDYATLRGPVGLNRVFASVAKGTLNSDEWLESLRAGRTFATNGPLLAFSLGDTGLGGTLDLAKPRPVSFRASLSSLVPVEHAQIVCNGHVVRELGLNKTHESLESRGELQIEKSGWCVLRAFTSRAEYPVLDNFIYATTSPVYVVVRGSQLRSSEDARYFVAWIEALAHRTALYPDFNSQSEKDLVLATLERARQVYEDLE